MTTYFIGDELECYSIYTASVSESTNYSISGYSRGTVYIPDGQTVTAPLTDSVTGLPTATNDVLWMHWRRNAGGSQNNRETTVWKDNTGTAKLRELSTGDWSSKMQIWNGTGWTDIINPVGVYGLTVWDIRIKIAVEGSIQLFKEGVLFASWTGDTSIIGNIGSVTFGSPGGGMYFHQLIIADYSTVNHTIRRRTPTANGTNAEWTGDFSLIDDAPSSTVGTDAITTSESGKKATFTAANLSAPANGNVIKAVAVAEFSRNDSTGQAPQNVRQILRVNGVDHEAPVNAPIDAGWRGGVAFWENNPETGAAWANIDAVNATEFGVVSKD